MKPFFLGTIFLYVLVLWFVGGVASRHSKGSEDYLVASRKFSTPFISALVAGTWIGGVSVMGMAQGAFLHGLSAIWFQAGIWVAMCFTAAFLPKMVMKKETYSILDVVAHYYDKRTANLGGLCLLALFFLTGWIKKFHPFWAVSGATLIIIGISSWIDKKKGGASS